MAKATEEFVVDVDKELQRYNIEEFYSSYQDKAEEDSSVEQQEEKLTYTSKCFGRGLEHWT